MGLGGGGWVESDKDEKYEVARTRGRKYGYRGFIRRGDTPVRIFFSHPVPVPRLVLFFSRSRHSFPGYVYRGFQNLRNIRRWGCVTPSGGSTSRFVTDGNSDGERGGRSLIAYARLSIVGLSRPGA